jgi:cation diffusion facilitator CzcD-associated flavoprotein CzcO
MTLEPEHAKGANSGAPAETLDAIIIGAGFAGIRALCEFTRTNHRVRAFEAGSDVGGTWYWNRYPGARTDSEAWAYGFTFSRELQDDWQWSERLPGQREVLKYLEHVVERFDLRRHITFGTRVEAATFDEQTQLWEVRIAGGECFRCRYLISATGVLSIPKKPEFPGAERFKGEFYYAPQWPKEPVDLSGKRVAIIGSAATAIQILPVIAKVASHVSFFQRTPNYVLPGRNYEIGEEHAVDIRRRYPAIAAQTRAHAFGLPMDATGRTYDSVDDAERHRIFERGWEEGGFHFCFNTFDDIMVDQRSNLAASSFIREKIRAIVKDPATAEALCPTYPFFSKRPPAGHFFYEAFNRDNVTLVDISQNGIEEITKKGVRTAAAEHEVDVIIMAIGFDAGTGPLMNIDVRGRGGVTIQEKWHDGPQTHLGIMVEDFPNLFMILGPQAPFGNIPTVIEGVVDWISDTIARMERDGTTIIEPRSEAVEGWMAYLEQIYRMTLLSSGAEVRTWFLGANIPGKPVAVMFHFGGIPLYLADLAKERDAGLPGFFASAKRDAAKLSQPA